MISFIGLFSAALCLGFGSVYSSRAMLLGLAIILVAPSALTFTPYIYSNGLYWVDGFGIGAVLAWLVRSLASRRIIIGGVSLNISLISLTILLYATLYVPFADLQLESLKDFRPIFFFMGVFWLLQYRGRPTRRLLSFFVALASISALMLSLIAYFYLGPLTADRFYAEQSVKYIGIQTFFCMGAAFYYSKERHLRYADLVAFFGCVGVVVLSGSRMLIFVFCLVVLLNYLARALSVVGLLRLVALSVAIGTGLLLSGEVVDRFSTILSQGLVPTLIHRFSPAIQYFNQLSPATFIFGNGFGTLFFVDWFVYRENVNNYSVQIDSLYITLLVKYGVVGTLIILFNIFRIFSHARIGDLGVVFLILAVTSSMVYHLGALGLFVVLAIVRLMQTRSSSYLGIHAE